MELYERLAALEASHVKLMTEHEVEVRKNDKAWRRHRKWLKEYEAQRAAADARYERDRLEAIERGRELDKRIADLVSGIGEFMRQAKP
jgi:hypothetical protein